MPLASVIIPAYNHAAYIREAVQSVLDQTLTGLELIVVDDGSTDNTLEVLQAFTDPRLRVIAQENRGAHAAINRGLSAAAGEYLAILNSDDAYHPRRLETLIPLLQANPRGGLAASYIQVIDREGRPLGVKEGWRTLEPWLLEHPERSFRAGDDLHAALLTENYLATTSNYVFRREWFERTGGFRPLRFVHDWDFALRVARESDILLAPEPLVRYRVHASNTIRQNQAAMVFEICWILAVHLPPSSLIILPGGGGVDRLLHSIYTFGCDRVLAVMLLQRLSERPEAALALLEAGNPEREKYIEFIAGQLKGQNQMAQTTPAGWKARIRRALKIFRGG